MVGRAEDGVALTSARREAVERRAEARRRLRRMRRRKDPFQQFYNLYARVYDQVFGPALHDGRVRSVELLNPRSGERVLEVGIGTGLTLPFYPRGVSVHGIDVAEKMLRLARRRGEKLLRRGRGPRVGLSVMNAGRLAYPDDSFDAAAASYVLTAVEDPASVLREIRRVLRPGGRLIVVNRIRSAHPVVRRAEESISALFEQVGFSIDVDVEPLLGRSGFRVVHSGKVNGFGRFKAIIARKAEH